MEARNELIRSIKNYHENEYQDVASVVDDAKDLLKAMGLHELSKKSFFSSNIDHVRPEYRSNTDHDRPEYRSNIGRDRTEYRCNTGRGDRTENDHADRNDSEEYSNEDSNLELSKQGSDSSCLLNQVRERKENFWIKLAKEGFI